MTDTTKPNGDRDRPSDREAAKNPRGPAMGPPEGAASSGSTSPPLDMALLRELAKEFGFYPATTNPEDIERHRRLNAAADAASGREYRYDPCDRCGRATRYKQFPMCCACTTPDRALTRPLTAEATIALAAAGMGGCPEKICTGMLSTSRRSGLSRRKRMPRCGRERPAGRPCGQPTGMRAGASVADLNMARLRELTDEFGYSPATTVEADIERHRRLNAALDRNYRPHRWDHLKAAQASAAMAIPTADEVGAVIRADDDEYAALIAACAFAGLRRGEASALSVSDVDFLRKEIRVARQVQWTDDGRMEIRPP
jgi:hypothetical protein